MSIFKKRPITHIAAVADGNAIPLNDVDDEAFSSGMLGTGFAVRPSDGTFYSPVNGTVEGVSDTYHAYSIRTDDGLDVLIHIGVDTVELGGKGFEPKVHAGDEVRTGDIIATADLDYLTSEGYDTTTPVLISNRDSIPGADLQYGAVRGGTTTVMTF